MIRKMKSSDLDRIMEIETFCFHDFWNRRQYEYELNDNPYAQLWVLVDDEGVIVGYYDLWIIFERAEIANIAIAPDCQHQGYGHLLMEHLLREAGKAGCETVDLEVRASNARAISLYENYDFSVINTKPGYYRQGGESEDGLYMMKGI